MSAREVEDSMLMRCATAARNALAVPQDQRDANVFRVAAIVIQSRFPNESARLMQASEDYFSRHPGDRVPAAEVVRNGWVVNLPRLRDGLSIKLRQQREP